MTSATTSFTFVDTASQIAADGLPSRPTSKRRSHICEICSTKFKRSEHLLRHVRAHRQEKPFGCRYCPKRFARKDLLTRHEKTLHSLQYESTNSHLDRGTQNPVQRVELQTFELTQLSSLDSGNLTSHIGGNERLAYDTNNRGQTSSPPQRNSPRREATGMAELTVNDFIPQECPTSFISEFDMTISPQQQINLQHATDILPSDLNPAPPDNLTGVVTEQVVSGSDPTSAMEQNMTAPNNCPESSQIQLPSFSMPTPLEYLEDFAMLDESFFAQVSFPIGIMDFEVSPQSLPFDDSTSSANYDAALSMREGTQQEAANASVPVRETPLPNSRTISNQQPSNRRASRARQPAIDELAKTILTNDLQYNYKVDTEQLKSLPSSRVLDNFLWKFFRCFQRHLPIFHVPTFNTMTTPGPLLLALCSIGALYTLDRKQADALRLVASNAMRSVQAPKYTGHQAPLEPVWQTQCRLLIIFGAMFGGNLGDASDGMSELGCFVRPYALRRSKLSTQTCAGHISTWEAWIDYELEKRLLCGVYIASSLNSATYDISPGFTSLRDLNFELPAEESLWEAQTRQEWQELMNIHQSDKPATIASLLHQLVFGDDSKTPNHSHTKTGAFGATVVMHGVNVHMYSLAQSMSSLITNNMDANIGYAVRLSHHTQTERALTRCHEFLRSWQLAHDDSVLNRHEESFIFNCQALLRLSYVRVCSGIRHFNRAVLLYGDDADISTAVNAYVNALQYRNPFLTKAAEQVMFCFTAPIRAGHMLTRKTAALTWSIEHAVASWDCTLFLSKWIYSVEIQGKDSGVSQEEKAVLEMLKEALGEADSPYDDQHSLAAQVTRAWAMFMDDVWVWEVTLRMGSILRRLADVYDSSWQRQRARNRTVEPATTPQLL